MLPSPAASYAPIVIRNARCKFLKGFGRSEILRIIKNFVYHVGWVKGTEYINRPLRIMVVRAGAPKIKMAVIGGAARH